MEKAKEEWWYLKNDTKLFAVLLEFRMMLIFLCLQVTVWSEGAPSLCWNVASVLSIISQIWITRDRNNNGSRGFSRARLGVWPQLCALLAVTKAGVFVGTRLWPHCTDLMVREHTYTRTHADTHLGGEEKQKSRQCLLHHCYCLCHV